MDLSSQLLSELTIFTKYARYIPELNRRETWEEIVTRNKQMHQKKYPSMKDEIEDAYKYVYDKKVLPSMRSMQFAGKPIDISPNRLFNCFGAETEFVTSEGLKKFSDYQDGDEIVVPTHLGNWKKATVRCYGRQPLNKVKFVRTKSKREVRVTSNHRWLLHGGEETTELGVGDVIHPTLRHEGFNYDEADPLERLYWCYGCVYGDGSRVKDSKGEYRWSMIRLCGAYNKQFAYRFEEMGFTSSSSSSIKGDVMFYTNHYLKTAPDLDKDPLNLVKAFMDGYLTADAEKNPDWYQNNKLSRYRAIQSSDEDHVEFLHKALDLCGYHVTSEKDISGVKTNFGEYRKGTTRFGITNWIGSQRNKSWSVGSIEKDAVDEVWCLEVEDDRSFILAGGIVTGNCAYLPIDDLRAFSETMFLLLGGTGVGYSVQFHHVEKLPEIHKPSGKRTRRYLIADNIEGWADAVKVLIKSYFKGGSTIQFDFSDIRQKGARLVTSGGKAPGPQPLRECIVKLQGILDSKTDGEKLTSLEVHDMICHIADAVLAGGIRRAALISLFSADDAAMISSKAGQWWESNPQRGRANNSAVLLRHRVTKEFFMDLWKRVELSGAGEPGIYFSNDKDWGTNPSLRAGTRIWTTKGVIPIEQLENCEFEIRNLDGQVSPAKCWLSGKDQPLYKLTLEGGHEYYATAEHKWPVWDGERYVKVNTPDIEVGALMKFHQTDTITEGVDGSYQDGFLAGWHLGDGWTTKYEGSVVHGLIVSTKDDESDISNILENHLSESLGTKAKFHPRKRHNARELNTINKGWDDFQKRFGYGHKSEGLPTSVWNNASEEFRKGLIDGLFSSDGSVEKRGRRIKFHSAHEKLAKDVSDLLGLYGIKHSVRFTQNQRKGVYTVDIAKGQSIRRFRSLFNLSVKQKQERIEDYGTRYNLSSSDQIEVIGVELTSLKEDVWDVSVDDNTHAFQLPHVVTGNCAEIGLRPFQFCNLCEVNVSDIDSQQEYNDRVKVAALIGTLQAGYTNFHYLRDVWRRTTEKEALIGIGMTGIGSGTVLGYDMKQAAKIVKDENVRVAELIGINKAARTTTVKPSGTSSLVLGTSSGIHAWHNKHYIRRMRMLKGEAIYTYLTIHHPELLEDEYFRPHDTAVVCIPQKAPEGAITRDESPFNLLDRVKSVCTDWIKKGHRSGSNTHNVSATISIQQDQWDDVGEWMWENREYYNGLSVLPYDDSTYTQMPFTDCDEATYTRMAKSLHSIDLTKVVEMDDSTDLKESLACGPDGCEIK